MSDLQRGIQLVQQAVQHDANNDIPEAIRYYSMALELFAAALQGTLPPPRESVPHRLARGTDDCALVGQASTTMLDAS